MGEASIALGRFEKGLEFFDKAIRLSPRDPDLSELYGAKVRAYLALKQYDQAIESARRAIAINPSSPSSGYIALSLAYLYTGQFESLEPRDQAIRLSPRDPDCYQHKSWHLFRDEAIRSGDRMGPPEIVIYSNDPWRMPTISCGARLDRP